jgi:tRNA uridine 5-carboxymethylaminomethyl modification enzyme
MFTSRAERRLILRQDNARFRMLPFARRLGLVDPRFLRETERYATETRKEIERLKSTRHEGESLDAFLRRPEVHYSTLPDADPSLAADVAEQVELQIKYEGYIQREERQASRARDMEAVRLPPELDYWSIRALRHETREKLSRIRPDTLGQAARISGVNPADIAVLSVYLRKHAESP